MSISVRTNTSAMIALENLNKTNDQLEDVQLRVNSGLKVNGAKDNASVWAIAQGQKADASGLSAVKMSLDRATSIADVSLAAGESVSDLLNSLREKTVAAMDPSLDPNSRTLLDADFQSLMRQVASIVSSAKFDGANILDGSIASDIQFLADADATTTITLQVQDLTLGGGIITLPSTQDITTVTNATAALALVDASVTNLNVAMGNLGAQAKQIEAHNAFIAKLSDALETGIGNLIDADLAKESARLQALQVQQQLGTQALSIANSAPQSILNLFRNG